jgi:hypothetical protein
MGIIEKVEKTTNSGNALADGSSRGYSFSAIDDDRGDDGTSA